MKSSDAAARDPIAGPSDNTTLTEVLGQFADGGFGGDFEVAGGGTTVRCLTCDEESETAEIPQHTLRRLEGASDPADMAAVAAITCPRCGAKGTIVLPYGPNASAADALVLAGLRDSRDDSAAPRSSAPGETVGDEGSTSRDVMPGEIAPAFSAPSSTGRELSLDDFLGKVPVAITFAGTLSPEATDELVDAFESCFGDFGRPLQALLVLRDQPETLRRRRAGGTKVPLLADPEGRMMENYAASGTFPATVLIDTDGTVSRLVEGGVAGDHADAVLSVSRRHQGRSGDEAAS